MVTFYSVILLGVACAWGGIYSAGIFVRMLVRGMGVFTGMTGNGYVNWT